MKSNLEEEKKVQESIFKCIDDFISFRFNAGAGSGKTYALIEAIKYILQHKIEKLNHTNQQIICITYTNVAVKEIKARLGLSDTVIISTIHERLWELIKLYQKELIELHKANLERNIAEIEDELADTSNNKYSIFLALNDEDKSKFYDFIFANKDSYYKSLSLPATEFKKVYNSIDTAPDFLMNMLSNVENFKSLVKNIYKKSKYQECVDRIEAGEEKKIAYDSRSNNDRLEYMKFSHDTLLEYSYTLIKNHPTLQRILVDKYPYFFIDEYQDTHEKVIGIVKELFEFSKKNNKSWMVGYFGDTSQNIYADGVGSKIESLEGSGVKPINKEFNRRSHFQIIDVINKIRNDNIKQRPLFDDRNEGQVAFYYFSAANEADKISITNNFLQKYKQDLSTSQREGAQKIHCLVLTNKLLAKLSGFGDIYDIVSGAGDIYWNEINTKLLSNDLEKLHPTIILIYNVVKLYKKITDDSTTYYDLFGPINKEISFKDIKKLSDSLKSIDRATLDSFISGLSQELDKNINKSLNSFFLKNMSIDEREVKIMGGFKVFIENKIFELMYGKSNEENNDDKNIDSSKVQDFLKIDIKQWIRWADFINREENDDYIFHTYHGTKGEEYENVAIIMEHSFGGGRQGSNKLKNFFLSINTSGDKQEEKDTQDNIDEGLENTKNLIYVACSRAIKSLRILYIDDITEIKSKLESIFGEVEEFKCEE